MADIARIEERIDRVAAGAVEVSDALGGLRFQNMTEVMEFAKLMSIAGNAVPKHLQQNPGMCLAVCVQALEWRFSPFAVANKSYEVQGRLSFESQLVHAVIEQRAPIIGRLRHRFEGEGEDRRCIVSATLRETGETLEYISPPIRAITPKNSPLWKSKPDLQLYYNTSRDFCRAYFPDVLLGVYAQDELRDHVGPDNAKDVSEKPDVGTRLKGKQGRGFNSQHVERETSRGVIDETTNTQSSAPADAGAASTESAAPLNSSETHQPPVASETKPAPLAEPPSLAGAGTPQSSAAHPDVAAEERQATEPGDSALHDSVGLPEDWQTSYAAALARAKEPDDLGKRHKEWFSDKGGYARHKSGRHFAAIDGIFKAFKNHFGPEKQETRNAILHELGVD